MQKHSLLNWKRKMMCVFFYYLEIFSVKSGWVHRLYMRWIGDIFVDEFHMARVTAQDKVLHIGCGPLPTMSVLAAKETQSKIVAIDINRNALQHAKHYIAKQHLSDTINVVYGDGTTYPVNSFDVIFIATNVTPVEGVFRNLTIGAKSQARIVCRDLGHGVTHLLQNQEFSPYFSIKQTQSHQKSSSLLIIKKG